MQHANGNTTTFQTATGRDARIGVSNSQKQVESLHTGNGKGDDQPKNIFQVDMGHGDTRRMVEESSPEGSPMRSMMAPQMDHNDEESLYGGQNMDDKCRHDLQPRGSHNAQ